jgi:hypothetical protein
MELNAISLATVPVALGWLALALTLGRTHEKHTTEIQQSKPQEIN